MDGGATFACIPGGMFIMKFPGERLVIGRSVLSIWRSAVRYGAGRCKFCIHRVRCLYRKAFDGRLKRVKEHPLRVVKRWLCKVCMYIV